MNEKSDLYKNVSPSKDNWLSCGCGYTGLAYSFVVTGNYARIELWINRGTQEENKEIFDNIHTYKENSNHPLEINSIGKGEMMAKQVELLIG